MLTYTKFNFFSVMLAFNLDKNPFFFLTLVMYYSCKIIYGAFL